MSTNQITCPKCNGSMVQGFMLDHGHYDAVRIGQWVEGHPIKNFFGAIKAPKKQQIPLGAFRCSACGYVELYAWDVFAPGKKST